MYDDDTGAEPRIISASFADPFLLLLRDDASLFVAQCDDNNELEEIEREDDLLLATKWVTGCLYTDTTGVFASVQSDKGQKPADSVLMFLLSAGGALHVCPSFHAPLPMALKFSVTDKLRSMLYPIYRRLYMLLKGSASYRQFYLRTTQLDGQLHGRLCLRSSLQTSAMKYQDLLISSYVFPSGTF